VFQFEAVCQVALVAPVQVWAFAADATPRREAITAVIRTQWWTLEIRTRPLMESSLPEPPAGIATCDIPA